MFRESKEKYRWLVGINAIPMAAVFGWKGVAISLGTILVWALLFHPFPDEAEKPEPSDASAP